MKYLHIHIVILKNDWDKEVGLGSDDTFDLVEKSKETINQMGFFFQFCDATKVAIIDQKI